MEDVRCQYNEMTISRVTNECSIIVGFLVCVLQNMDLCVCDFAICDIGMKIVF